MNEAIKSEWRKHNTPVLIVDDDPHVLDVIRLSLTARNIFCLSATSVAEACSLVEKEKISLILLDWKLDRSGMEVLRTCREIYPLMPVIVMSGLPLDIRTDAMLAEADGFLQKPFSPAVIVSHVERWLRRLSTASTSLPEREEEILLFEDLKRTYLYHVVKLLQGNVTVAAEKLGMHRHTLSSALKTWETEKIVPIP